MKKIYLATLISAMALFISCNRDEEENEEENLVGNIEVKFDLKWEELNFQLDNWYTNSDDSIKFSTLKFYISNIEFTSVDGSVWKEENSYYLVDAEEGSLSALNIENIPSGEYVGMSFKVGVDSTKNVSGAQTGALSASKGMFWNWNTGYIFIRAEGESPSLEDNEGRFIYHVGGFSGENNAIRSQDYDFDNILSVSPSAKPSIHIHVKTDEIWGNEVVFPDYSKVHMPGSKAAKIADNFSNGFILDHTHR